MGGSSKDSTSSYSQNTQTDPWARTIPTLDNLIGQINGQTSFTSPTAAETSGLSTLAANAANGNPYAPAINGLASNLLAGGGPDQSGYTLNGYNQLQSTLSPIANQSTDPYQNASFLNLKNTLTNDITDQVKSAYAGAGYSPVSSGDFAQQLARGLGQGIAPAYMQAQGQLTGQASDAAKALYQGGASTSGVLSGLNQTTLGNMLQGVGTSTDALNANDSAALRAMQVAQMGRQLPLQNIGNLESLIVPMAALGGTSNTNGTQTTHSESNPGLLGTMMGIGSLFSGGQNSAASGLAGAGLGLLGWL